MRLVAWLVCSSILAGCTGGAGVATPADAGVPVQDAASAVAQPAPPVLTPCAPGWREVASSGDPVVCEPWPESGAVDCTGAQAHFPGEPGCTPVGRPCPTGPFADDLPTDALVLYVSPGAVGGDGSRALPFGRIADALAAAPTGTTIALAKGEYDEPTLAVRAGVALRGACAAETRLRSSEATDLEPVIGLLAPDTSLEDVSIVDSPRMGLWVGATSDPARIDGVVIAGTSGIGLVVANAAALTAHDLVVRDTRIANAAGLTGVGSGIVVAGATATLSRVALERDAGNAFTAHDGASVTLEDAVVRDVVPSADGRHGQAITVTGGAHVTVRRAVLERLLEFGVFVRGAGTSLELEDSIVRDTAAQRIGVDQLWRGRGVIAFEGASASLTRTLVERNHQAGIQSYNVGSLVSLEDVVVRETLPVRDPVTNVELGHSIVVDDGASARVVRAVFARGSALSVQVQGVPDTSAGVSTASFEDVTVRATEGDPLVGARAIQAVGLATADLSRVRVEGAQMLGISCAAGATMTARDVTVYDTQPAPCGEPNCSNGGIAIGAYLGGAIDLRGFQIARAALCGVHVAEDGSLDLHDGAVSDSAIGACVQVDGYDLSRLTDGVRFESNGTNLETTMLPIPTPISAF